MAHCIGNNSLLHISKKPIKNTGNVLMDTSNIKEKETGVKKSADERDPLVDKPAHYTGSHIEAIDYIYDNLSDGFGYYLEGSIKKYLHRWRLKSQTDEGKIRDLKKAAWYLDKLIKDVEEHGVPECHM